MKLEELKKQLSSKLRTTKDLIRFIKTRTDSNPNYTLLFGAGCSVSSGIRPATTLCDIWRTEILQDVDKSILKLPKEEQQEWLKKNHGEWYNPQREYSTLFEKKYDLQRQRRMFVENEVKFATPSIGYAYLTTLVEQNYFNTIFTTNFDDLLNEAFFLYGKQRPIVCAHDSSINSVTVTSKRPKIIKLHGDYLFDDIKATDRETESLGQNMKEKFIEFAKDFGMIVVGYAGGDRSIIDVLSLLLKNDDYFRNGLYWCIRKESDISEELKRLLWKDRVYFVEIDGYDELVAELYSDFNNGECLPFSAAQAYDQHEQLIKKLLSNPIAFPETNQILKNAKTRMQRQSKRKAIANSLVNPEEKDRPLSNSEYTDDELLILTNLQRLQRDKKYLETINQARAQLAEGSRSEVTTQVANILINSHVALRQESEALRVIEKFEKEEPINARWPLRRAQIASSRSEKLAALEEALKRDDQSAGVYRAFASFHQENTSNSISEEKAKAYKDSVEAHTKSLELDPSRKNTSWSSLHKLYQKHENNKPKRNDLLNKLEDDLTKQGKLGWRLLTLQIDRIDSKTDEKTISTLLSKINEAKSRVPKDENIYFERLRLRVFRQSNNYNEVKTLVNNLVGLAKHSTDSGLAVDLASCLRRTIGDDQMARLILQENLSNDEFNVDVLSNLFTTLIELKEYDEAEDILNLYKSEIIHSYEIHLKRLLMESKGEFSRAMEMLDKEIELGESENAGVRSYLLLLQGKNEEAKKICRTYLETVNFSPEASVEIVNHELAAKKLGLKVDGGRLDRLINFDASDATKAAVCALRGYKKESIAHIREIFKADKTFRYDIDKWPVFEDIRHDEEYLALLKRPH